MPHCSGKAVQVSEFGELSLRMVGLSVVENQTVKIRHLLPAAVLLIAAVFGNAQQPAGNKHNTRPETVASEAAAAAKEVDPPRYTYEFTQPEFTVRRILIEHDTNGRGQISFEKLNEGVPVEEPLSLSPAAVSRILKLWQALRFLESEESYQTERQYPHLGTMRLKMEQGARKRTAEFNWTSHKNASMLVQEYRRVADQAILVFDLSVARESQPLNAPKLMEQFEQLLKRNGLSDPQQLVPLLRDLNTDERIPLIARNHAGRLLTKLGK
jgi:hypothetical protein